MTIPSTPTSTSTPRTVLIVEDELISRRALSLLLSSCGYTTAACGSAEEAVTLLHHGTAPAVAVIDLDLPGMSGLELISVLASLDPMVHPVLVTGADSERLELALRDRQVDVLRKPLNFPRLLELLDQPWAPKKVPPS